MPRHVNGYRAKFLRSLLLYFLASWLLSASPPAHLHHPPILLLSLSSSKPAPPTSTRASLPICNRSEEVVVERNSDYFREAPQITRVRFRVVPDAVVRALALQKGTADLEMSSLSSDIIPVLERQPAFAVTDGSGTNFTYLGCHLEDAVLWHREIRQALALAANRQALIHYLLQNEAKLASGVLTHQIRVEINQEKGKALCREVPTILAEDLPYLPMWYNEVVSVHRRSLGNLDLPSAGNYKFFATLHANRY